MIDGSSGDRTRTICVVFQPGIVIKANFTTAAIKASMAIGQINMLPSRKLVCRGNAVWRSRSSIFSESKYVLLMTFRPCFRFCVFKPTARLVRQCPTLHTGNHERSDETTIRINQTPLGRLLYQEQNHWSADQLEDFRQSRGAATAPPSRTRGRGTPAPRRHRASSRSTAASASSA